LKQAANDQSINQPTNQPINQPTEPTNKPTNKPTNQQTNKPTNKPRMIKRAARRGQMHWDHFCHFGLLEISRQTVAKYPWPTEMIWENIPA